MVDYSTSNRSVLIQVQLVVKMIIFLLLLLLIYNAIAGFKNKSILKRISLFALLIVFFLIYTNICIESLENGLTIHKQLFTLYTIRKKN